MAKAATALLCFIFMLIVILLCVTFDHLHIAAGIILMTIISWTIFLYCGMFGALIKQVRNPGTKVRVATFESGIWYS